MFDFDSGAYAPFKMAVRLFTIVALVVTPGLLAAKATGPSIKLFPTTVLEDIRETGQVAAAMETGLQEVISRLDQQQILYVEAKCDGAEGDPGCDQIARQLGATYLEMLEIMGEHLPDMERAVTGTRNSLEKRLRTEVGKKLTPWTLQETLLGNQPDGASAVKPELRGRSGLRLSQRFRQYYQLVANSGRSSEHSLAVVAADIYLDMDEAAGLIARTQEEIARATLMEQLNQSFGTITDEMQEIVGGVKSILFGDFEAPSPVADPPPGTVQQAYTSPLEM